MLKWHHIGFEPMPAPYVVFRPVSHYPSRPPRVQESNLYGWNAGSSTAELMMHGMGRMSQP